MDSRFGMAVALPARISAAAAFISAAAAFTVSICDIVIVLFR